MFSNAQNKRKIRVRFAIVRAIKVHSSYQTNVRAITA